MGHCVHHHSSSVNLWPQLLGIQTYHICYYVIRLWLIRRIWWYILTLWPSKWGQSPRQMINGAKQTESMKWCKLTNYETYSRKARDGNVGGREELTGLVVDASVFCLMQFDSQRHVDLTVYSKIHRSFLSLTADCSSAHPSGPLLHQSFPPLSLSAMDGLKIGLLDLCLKWMEVSHMATNAHMCTLDLGYKWLQRDAKWPE